MYGPLQDTQVPLKPNEKHCYYCDGYGTIPIRKDGAKYTTHEWCYHCQGSGKQ